MKKILICLLIVLTLLLTGCSKEIKDDAKDVSSNNITNNGHGF